MEVPSIPLDSISSQAPNSGVIVLGMHRSGTSAVTRLIEAMGLFVGENVEIKAGSRTNPRGFFERHDVRSIADSLLHSAGADWWKVRDFQLDNIAEAVRDDQLAVLGEVITKLGQSGRRWVLKDPRLCFLLPVFRRAIERPFVVFVFRHPIEVAKSLHERDGIPTMVGLAMWEAYNIAAMRNSEGLDRLMVNFDDLVADPATSAERIASAISAWAGSEIGEPSTAAAAIDPTLRREVATDEDRGLVSFNQMALWRALLADGNEGDIQLSPQAMRILADFEVDEARRVETSARMRVLRKAAMRVDRLERVVAGKDAKLEKVRLRSEARAAELRDELSKRDHRIEVLAKRLDDSSRAVAKMRAKLASETERLQEATERLERIEKSMSWRATRPLRMASGAARALLGRLRRVRD